MSLKHDSGVRDGTRHAAKLDQEVMRLATKYRPLAIEILREAVRIPADYVDRTPDEGGDPRCGLTNHEGPRLEYLRGKIVEVGAVARAEDVGFDGFGNLMWTIQDPDDGLDPASKIVVLFDGHSDTVNALRLRWKEALGSGVDAYEGLTDASQVDGAVLRRELGYLPAEEEWEHLLFGRGSADQLGGVVCQIIATKIALELMPLGALRGVVVRSYATVAEEDNEGGGPMFIMREALERGEGLPDVVLLTEGTGCAQQGALGIYRGQRGRMQIEVVVTGKSCHGSMPWEGKNPLEYGAAIIEQAAAAYQRREGFADHAFLGHGTRTASLVELETPSDCAVPERLTIRFDRRLTVGESPEQALADIEALAGVAKARADGLSVQISVPRFQNPTWKGYPADNPQIYPGWVTPEDHPAIQTAVETYTRVASPQVQRETAGGGLRKTPRLARWIFSTDGVGFPMAPDEVASEVVANKRWVDSGAFVHPPMLGIGPGIEQNTHKVGECVDTRELDLVSAVLARFPSLFVSRGTGSSP